MTQLALMTEITVETNKTKPPKPMDENIIGFVRNLGKLDAGERGQFKRSAGKSLAEATSAIGLFYRILPPTVPHYHDHEEMYFLVAALYAIRYRADETLKPIGNFGASLRQARQKDEDKNKGLNRRVEILLDSEQTEQLAYRLRHAVQLLKSQNISINWLQLLQDLLQWQRGRFVQKRWAKSYFVGSEPEAEDK